VPNLCTTGPFTVSGPCAWSFVVLRFFPVCPQTHSSQVQDTGVFTNQNSMQPCLQTPVSCSGASEGLPHPGRHLGTELAATAIERVHSVLRSMSDEDWEEFKSLMKQNLPEIEKGSDVALFESLFRKGEALAREATARILRLIHSIAGNPPLLDRVKKANERLRTRIRFILHEMPDSDWSRFRQLLINTLPQAEAIDYVNVLELVVRIGESVSNIEVAAAGLADKLSGRKLIDPEVARRNALIRPRIPGAPPVDPEQAYLAAKQELQEALELASRAESTLAYAYVEPTPAYKHARHTVFQLVEAIIASPELMAEAAVIEKQLLAVPIVSRQNIRWALHRMPIANRVCVLKLIPLNTVLMFREPTDSSEKEEVNFRATRDRRLAYDHFVGGESEDELSVRYGLSLHGVKNAIGMLLDSLAVRPLACAVVNRFLLRVRQIELMQMPEIRRRMKLITASQRAQLLNLIPNGAWKARGAIHLHKSLFLDYMSGEWVLARLVDFYNLEQGERISGKFKMEGTLTVRGANAAIEGILRKIADEPCVRQRLRELSSLGQGGAPSPEQPEAAHEENLVVLMPPPPRLKLHPIEPGLVSKTSVGAPLPSAEITASAA
jgi:hypothetical protein